MDKEPIDWTQLAVAVWPLWLVLLILGVLWLLMRFDYMAPDSYEEPPPAPDYDANINAKWRD
jgi:hypothetical protein